MDSNGERTEPGVAHGRDEAQPHVVLSVLKMKMPIRLAMGGFELFVSFNHRFPHC